ncbi:MAG: bifunctional D-glycero-beta-D-manno-heptose-7-phosphate kinase/D-glycero-beta-D-manno-heptose 1-phosphate adenylyltransferase HldE [Gammaproteobacteria bacterium]|nr:bifunctional D-glycero-beta-D-manno-heptose-7-phosphate kinase/D-glycero-beta-D-manno-heptose 1-phosphate adenylyltransferase HldE [Gammaproteobacteria bacterium]
MTNNNLPNFKQASILVIGDVMLDRYWFGDAARISPEAPVPIVKINQIDERPGGAGNVALNIASLGAKVTLLGVTGNDEAARILSEQLIAMGVNSAILNIDNIPTITKLRVISRHQQLIRLDFEEKFPSFNPQLLLDAYQKALEHADIVILSDYGKGTLTDPQAFIRMAKEANVPILVDPKGTNFKPYCGANVITPNLKEFEIIVGPCQNEREIFTKGQAFLEEYNIEALLLTRGERGMTLIQKGQEEHHLPAHAREVFDVTGAGDTVIAVLAASLAAHASLPSAMSLANLAAGLVVAKLGAATISSPELEVALNGTEMLNGGVLNEEQLLIAVNDARLHGKKVVFTNGCFDILHAGHVKYMQQAKQLGDYLIVAVNDDDSITRLKGPGRPINNVEQRMAVLAGLGAIDWVVSFTDDTPKRLLKILQPDILVKGGDYTLDQVVGAEIVLAYGGDVRVLSLSKGISTTKIIDRMVKSVSANEEVSAHE